MNWHELMMTAVRGVGVYVLMLIVIRLLGKRTIGNFTAFDLLVALMLGEVVDEIIYGEISFLQGTIAILVIAGAKYMTAWLSYLGLNTILEGKPVELVRDGELLRQGMRSELMNEQDVFATLRIHGIDDLREVKLAVLEVDGEVSVIRQPWAEPVQKRDLQGGGKRDEMPPEEKRTDSPRALGRKS